MSTNMFLQYLLEKTTASNTNSKATDGAGSEEVEDQVDDRNDPPLQIKIVDVKSNVQFDENYEAGKELKNTIKHEGNELDRTDTCLQTEKLLPIKNEIRNENIHPVGKLKSSCEDGSLETRSVTTEDNVTVLDNLRSINALKRLWAKTCQPVKIIAKKEKENSVEAKPDLKLGNGFCKDLCNEDLKARSQSCHINYMSVAREPVRDDSNACDAGLNSTSIKSKHNVKPCKVKLKRMNNLAHPYKRLQSGSTDTDRSPYSEYYEKGTKSAVTNGVDHSGLYKYVKFPKNTSQNTLETPEEILSKENNGKVKDIDGKVPVPVRKNSSPMSVERHLKHCNSIENVSEINNNLDNLVHDRLDSKVTHERTIIEELFSDIETDFLSDENVKDDKKEQGLKKKTDSNHNELKIVLEEKSCLKPVYDAKPNETKRLGRPPILGNYHCVVCPFVAKEKSIVRQHQDIMHASVPPCAQCNKRYKSWSSYIKHMVCIHGAERSSLCGSICAEKSQSEIGGNICSERSSLSENDESDGSISAEKYQSEISGNICAERSSLCKIDGNICAERSSLFEIGGNICAERPLFEIDGNICTERPLCETDGNICAKRSSQCEIDGNICTERPSLIDIGGNICTERPLCEIGGNICAERPSLIDIGGNICAERPLCEIGVNICAVRPSLCEIGVNICAERPSLFEIGGNICAERPSLNEIGGNICAERPLCAIDGNICAERPLCEIGGNICAERPSLCEIGGNICAERPSLCAIDGNICAERPLCAIDGNICAERPSLCEIGGNICAERPSLCEIGGNICAERPSLCEIGGNICAERPLCAIDGNICAERPLCENDENGGSVSTERPSLCEIGGINCVEKSLCENDENGGSVSTERSSLCEIGGINCAEKSLCENDENGGSVSTERSSLCEIGENGGSNCTNSEIQQIIPEPVQELDLKPTCQICGCVTNSLQELRQHHAFKHGKRFQCVICGFRVKNKSDLKSHLLVHSNERPFKCTFPGCTYGGSKTRSDLNKHKRIHQKISKKIDI